MAIVYCSNKKGTQCKLRFCDILLSHFCCIECIEQANCPDLCSYLKQLSKAQKNEEYEFTRTEDKGELIGE